MESLIRLSRMVGPSCVGWRYDPVFLTDKYDLSFHIRKFEEMAAFLAGHVDHCVISFIDLYEKTKRNFPQAREVRSEEQMTLGRAFAEIGQTYGIAIRSCCESAQLASVGIDVSGCMTRQVLERAVGASLTIAQKKKPLRESCSCVLGNDIGMYNTCGHGCLYCYANYDQKSVRANQKLHDPESPFLIGGSRPGDRIHEAKQESYIDGQMTLWSDWIG
jgi:hypothetical protein